MSKKCCVIPESLKHTNQRLNEAFKEYPQNQCQFINYEPNTHEYQGNYYCFLHLPCAAKVKKENHKQVNAKIKELIQSGETNFNFICVEDVKFLLTRGAAYSFAGAWITSMELSGSHPTEVCIAYSKLQGEIIIKKLETDRFDLLSSEISTNFHFIDSKTDFFFARGNKIGSENMFNIFQDYSFKFLIRNSKIETIKFFCNEFFIPLKICDIQSEAIELLHSKFHSAPIFFKEDLKNIAQLNMPKRNEFFFSFYPSLYEKFKDFFTLPKDERLSKKYIDNSVWESEYKKFREIYNIVKVRDMYAEQSDYFSLMQKCFRKTNDASFILIICSHLYHILSDYGQSIAKPIIGIFTVFLISTFIFTNLGVDKNNAAYLSLMQILKPYSMLYDRESKLALSALCTSNPSILGNNDATIQSKFKNTEENKCLSTLVQYKHGWLLAASSILESTLSLLCLTCLVLALRWNFRKT